MHADEAATWDDSHERFAIKSIGHQEAYSLDGACIDVAEEYFSRLRRAKGGIYHHIAGSYLLRYARGSSWREDNRRVSDGDQVNRVTVVAFAWPAISNAFTIGSVRWLRMPPEAIS